MSQLEERAKFLGEGDIPKVLTKLAIPAIIGMLINAIYNIVDTMFVGMLNNTSAIGAVTVAFPIFILIAAIGIMFGIGGASYISRLLGENNKKQADITASTNLITAFIVAAGFTIVGLIGIEPLLKMFGATETIMPFAKGYGTILMSGSIFTILNMTMNNMIRAEGNPKYSMYALIIGAGLNIILDPILMFGFGMGIEGAALATVIGQIVSNVYLLSYYLMKKSYVKVRLRYFNPSIIIYSQILKVGIATFFRQTLASVAMGLINTAAKPFGDPAIAAVGITLRVISMSYMVVFGYNQGYQPVVGFNYGAKKFDRVREAKRVSIKRLTVFCTLAALVFLVFAEPIIGLFSSDSDVINIGSQMIRFMSVLMPFFGLQQVNEATFQALGRGREALVLSVSRQGLFLLPAVIILPRLFNLTGVLMVQPFADFFTIILTVFLSIRFSKQLHEEEKEYVDENDLEMV